MNGDGIELIRAGIEQREKHGGSMMEWRDMLLLGIAKCIVDFEHRLLALEAELGIGSKE